MAFVKNQSTQPVLDEERQQPRDCKHLVAELENPNPGARRWAARDLMDCPDASAALIRHLEHEKDISVREVILTTLTTLGDDVAVAGLVECLRSDSALVRNEAIEAMKQLPDEVALIMRGLLNDSDPDVRIFAVNILESLRHPDVEMWLITVIENDQQLNVCATAVDLLGEVGTAASREPLQRLQKRFSDVPYIQFATKLALQRINGE
ncbi:HEAT repeat domain-containing protein [Candidatus Symbiobacter mobilis]|uniref:Repeat-containing PBS lyase heat domain protein n=1 Tax=Candidatus Symbiobacter mobilis CR TaxID=946483 RepID=U5NAQ7_9BURK|nr:HEAT repeat domain-containing protein [Candidatus Symbiobacter mobilis]AGX87284.1 repeat-containing PBS lyase heat domain protein [Candidatus Symbiobacter mobilis CR]